MQLEHATWILSYFPSSRDFGLIATIIVFYELLTRLKSRASHDCRNLFARFLQFLIPILSHLALQYKLLLVELAELRAFRLQPLELLVHFGELVGELLLFLLHICHHSLELNLSLGFRLVLNLLVALVAASEFVTVFNLCLFANFCLCLFSTLFPGLDASSLQLCDAPVVEVVQSFAGEDQLATKSTEQAHAGVVEEIDGDDLLETGNKRHNVLLVVDLVRL